MLNLPRTRQEDLSELVSFTRVPRYPRLVVWCAACRPLVLVSQNKRYRHHRWNVLASHHDNSLRKRQRKRRKTEMPQTLPKGRCDQMTADGAGIPRLDFCHCRYLLPAFRPAKFPALWWPVKVVKYLGCSTFCFCANVQKRRRDERESEDGGSRRAPWHRSFCSSTDNCDCKKRSNA